MKGKAPLRGEKHILWDCLLVDITKFKQYLNFVVDKSVVARKALQKCAVANEAMQKWHLETTHNDINLLNEITNTHLQTLGVKDIIVFIVWARKIIEKHNHMKNVQSKEKWMKQNVKNFKNFFGQLFQKDLPYFLDDKGELVP